MKKRLSILFVLLICMLSGAQAQLTKTVELTEAGTLEAALGDDIANVTELIVKGPLNDDDFTTMREKMKTLQILDMSGVTELPIYANNIDNVVVNEKSFKHRLN